jgi:hypothetical protein
MSSEGGKLLYEIHTRYSDPAFVFKLCRVILFLKKKCLKKTFHFLSLWKRMNVKLPSFSISTIVSKLSKFNQNLMGWKINLEK